MPPADIDPEELDPAVLTPREWELFRAGYEAGFKAGHLAGRDEGAAEVRAALAPAAEALAERKTSQRPSYAELRTARAYKTPGKTPEEIRAETSRSWAEAENGVSQAATRSSASFPAPATAALSPEARRASERHTGGPSPQRSARDGPGRRGAAHGVGRVSVGSRG
jgi:hypothetical protein